MKQLIIKYGIILFVILSGFKFLEFQFFSHNLSLEIYIAIVSTIFLIVGFVFAKYWIYKKLSEPENISEQTGSTIDQEKLSEFSQREQDVLNLMCNGYANKEIAEALGISPNTVKTHISRLFTKLDVHNRTQALAEAKSLNLIH